MAAGPALNCFTSNWPMPGSFVKAPSSFATSYRNKRKRREWTVYNALLEGEVLPGVHEIEAPEGVHVVDFVTREWLPRAPRPLQVGLD